MSADTASIPPARFAAALKDLSIGMLHLKVLEIRNSIAHLQYSNDQLKPFAEGSSVALGDPATSSTDNAQQQQQQPDQDCVDAIRENEQVIHRMAERLALIRSEVEGRGLSWSEFRSKIDLGSADGKVNGEEGGLTNVSAAEDGHSQGGEQQQQQQQQQTGRRWIDNPLNAARLRAVLGEPIWDSSDDDDDDDDNHNHNHDGEGARHSAWTDGTFQTGTMRGGQVHMTGQPGSPGEGADSLDDEQRSVALQDYRHWRPDPALDDHIYNLAIDDDDAENNGGLHL